ncbi:MAG: putative lipid II flippase FtsW [Lachnospiraceae bacterium]|nr:putative lipid II flippase FtsW [Lachnospiraceae bacterium]MDE6624768.1 putative lipid II flippase FtsW [Lachnospiraceae bacterium]
MANRNPRRRTKKKSLLGKLFPKWYRGNYFDYALLFLVIFLVAFGLIMIYSTSSYTAELKTGVPTYYLVRQGIFAIFGFFVMLIVSCFDYHYWKRLSVLLILFCITLLAAVLVVGVVSHGAARWIELGFISFQPSELAKIAIILYTAHAATDKAARISQWQKMVQVMLLPMITIMLIAKENLSTAIICAAITIMIVFVTSPKIKPFIVLGLFVVAVMGFFLKIAAYRLERIKIWLHPEDYENGYQTLQALYAIGSGGLFGKGLGQSIQKLGFIPESHNDMIFSVVCEELGLFGAACVIVLFILLIWRCVIIAVNAKDLYGALIVVGVVTHISVQVIVNIAVVTNTFPPTGVPLPFISYGGTALVGLLVEIGLVLSVARHIPMPKEY